MAGPPQWYKAQRDAFVNEENAMRLGSQLTLNAKEAKVSELLMTLKKASIERSPTTSHPYPPSVHYFKAKSEIDQSEIFKLIEKMPKGGALHVHSEAMASLHFIIKDITCDPNLYSKKVGSDVREFKISNETPGGTGWRRLEEERNSYQNPREFDDKLYNEMSIWTDNPTSRYPTVNDVWIKFNEYFQIILQLLEDTQRCVCIMMQGIKEFYQDGVQYLELRITFQDDALFDRLYEEIEKFKKSHPDFIGVKFIICKPRFLSDEEQLDAMKQTMKLMKKYPGFLIGFDLVGQEDTGKSLIEYMDTLLHLWESDVSALPFFFHAGETDWTQSTDMNLIDAVLLNTTRIGHGFAALKHPKVMDVIRKKKIAIELNPVSNQVLGLVSDLRNHPGAIFFSEGDPVVISSDDPTVWNASPLSHDFYMAFMALGGANDDLRLLKQLAINSITYSTMTTQEKEVAMSKWQASWDAYIDQVININSLNSEDKRDIAQ